MNLTSPIFIGGEARAGTRLLRSIIAKIPGVYEIQRETYVFVRDERISGTEFSQLEERGDKRGLLMMILLAIHYRKEIAQEKFTVLNGAYENALKIWKEYSCDAKQNYDEKIFSLFVNMQNLLKKACRYEIFDFVLDCLCEEHNCRRWVEKTPANVYHVDNIFGKYPGAKFIAIVRNPYAVYASWKKKDKSKSIFGVILAWKKVMKQVALLRETMPAERFLSINYEDLITNPEEAIRKICSFLGEFYSPDLLDVEVINTHSEKRGQRGFDGASLDNWKRELNALEKLIIKLGTCY